MSLRKCVRMSVMKWEVCDDVCDEVRKWEVCEDACDEVRK